MPNNTNSDSQESYIRAHHIASILYNLIGNGEEGEGFRNMNGELREKERVFTLNHIRMTFLQECIQRDLAQNPEVFCFNSLMSYGGVRWSNCQDYPAPPGWLELPFAEIKKKKILSLPCLELATRGSTTTNSVAFKDCLKCLFKGYEASNLPLPEKIIFNCGSRNGIHVVTMVFDFNTWTCQALDDFGAESSYDHIYNGAVEVMNNALAKAGWEGKAFGTAERGITRGFHTSDISQNPFGPGPGTCYASSLLLAVIAAKYPDDLKKGICEVLRAHLGNEYDKTDLYNNSGNALAKFSWSWLASVIYHLAKKHPEELYRIGGASQRDEQTEPDQAILKRMRDFILKNSLTLLGENDRCMQLLRGAPVREESKSTATGNKTTGDTDKAKPSAKPPASTATGNKTTGDTDKAKPSAKPPASTATGNKTTGDTDKAKPSASTATGNKTTGDTDKAKPSAKPPASTATGNKTTGDTDKAKPPAKPPASTATGNKTTGDTDKAKPSASTATGNKTTGDTDKAKPSASTATGNKTTGDTDKAKPSASTATGNKTTGDTDKAKPSASTATGNKTTGDTDKAKPSAEKPSFILLWPFQDTSKKYGYKSDNKIRKLIERFSTAAPDSKTKSFFDANVSFIRKIPIIRAICNWILFGWPFGKLFRKYSFEGKLADKLGDLAHQKCTRMMSRLEELTFNEEELAIIKRYRKSHLNKISNEGDITVNEKDDIDKFLEVIKRSEDIGKLTTLCYDTVALTSYEEGLTIENLLEKLAKKHGEDKNLSLDKFLEGIEECLDDTIQNKVKEYSKKLEAEKQKNQGTELSSSTYSTKLTKEGESAKIASGSAPSVQAR